MDATETLAQEVEAAPTAPVTACPRCAEPAAGPGSLTSTLLPGAALRRCRRCGTRFVDETGRERPLLTCRLCELPFLADRIDDDAVCADCVAGRVPDDLPHASLAAATEQEILQALESRRRFLTSEASAVYLESLVRRVAKCVDGAPPGCRVVLLDDPALKTLALPSGTIVLSQETLDDLEDEAQLVFLLAHELAHAASDATGRLIRVGLREVTREDPVRDEEAWADLAEDIVRLGYGRRREREADARGLGAVLELGYDPRSVIRYLRRLEKLGAREDDRLRELLLAHPPAGERIRRIEETLAGRVDDGEARLVNREVLRRAARSHADAVTRTRLGEVGNGVGDESGPEKTRRPVSWLPWVGAVAALLAALAALLLFAR
jgi:hypothetical protein